MQWEKCMVVQFTLSEELYSEHIMDEAVSVYSLSGTTFTNCYV